jgi:hypothetical protein
MRTTIICAMSVVLTISSRPVAQQPQNDSPPSGRQVWPSQPPNDCPFANSAALTGILFTGRHSDYRCGDTWYPCWAADDNQYSPWTDGGTVGLSSNSGGEAAVTGQAVLIGNDPLQLTIKNTAPPQAASPRPYEGRCPCGSLVYNNIWYFGEQGYFLNSPSKFISADGRTLWLCYSANFAPDWHGAALKINPPGGRYGLCLHEVQLLMPGETPAGN